MVDLSSFLKNADEFLQFQRLEEKANISINDYNIMDTNFLDPFWQDMALSIKNREPSLAVSFFGAYDDAERKIAVYSPDFMQLTEEDFISVVGFKNQFNDIKHSDCLGRILSLGINRDHIGDIIVGDEIFFVIKKSIENFLISEFRDIRRHSIELKKYELSYFRDFMDKMEENKIFKEKIILIPSLRADAILSKLFNISRQKAQEKISKGELKINHRVEERASTEIKLPALISLRGYGRVQIEEEIGLTQKGKIRIRIRK